MVDWPYFEPIDDTTAEVWDPPPLITFEEDLLLPPEPGGPGPDRRGRSLIMTWLDRLSPRRDLPEAEF